MEDARRFLRYVTPGLLYVIETGLLLAILVPWWLFPRLASLKTDAGVGIVLATLLASGGVGFLFSTLHHAWHWLSPWTSMNHESMIKRLVANDVLSISSLPKSKGPREVTSEDAIDRRLAWIATTILWHERLGRDPKAIGGADPRTSGLTDLVHSLGTTRVASLLAALTAFTAPCVLHGDPAFEPVLGGSWSVAGLIAGVIFFVQHTNYARTCGLAQAVIDSVLADALIAEKGDRVSPISLTR